MDALSLTRRGVGAAPGELQPPGMTAQPEIALPDLQRLADPGENAAVLPLLNCKWISIHPLQRICFLLAASGPSHFLFQYCPVLSKAQVPQRS